MIFFSPITSRLWLGPTHIWVLVPTETASCDFLVPVLIMYIGPPVSVFVVSVSPWPLLQIWKGVAELPFACWLSVSC